MAARVTGTELIVSCAEAPPVGVAAGRDGVRAVTVEAAGELAARLGDGRLGALGRLRTLGEAPDPSLRAVARDRWLALLDDRPAPSGRVELARWLREQTVSETRHRYGNPW
jgi:RHH-type proline utilization regulon transcriptional repressor/proline dehydrogenase/delta 1-pyrroline-5-carboxylate dehydrogenase